MQDSPATADAARQTTTAVEPGPVEPTPVGPGALVERALGRRQLLGGIVGAGALAALTGCTSPPPATRPAAGGPTGSASTTPSPSRTPAAPPAPSSATTPGAPPDWRALRSSLDGRLTLPEEPGYDGARLLFNRRFDDRRPAAVAAVSSEDDVVVCLAFARRHQLPVSVRSGGHSYLGASAGPGLVIDLRRLDDVRAGSGTAVVGAGAALIDVYAGLAAAGVSVPAGSCPAVGIGGLALGGGMGVVARRYGLTCDRLVSARVVLADGSVVTASATSEPDLFWALRGGGGSFGVVTSMELTTHPTQDLATFTLRWPFEAAADVLSGWQSTVASAPDELWTTCHLLATTGSTPTASVSGVLVGTPSELEPLVAAITRAVGDAPSSRSLRGRSYLDTMLLEAGCSDRPVAGCHVAGQSPGGTLERDAFVAGSTLYDSPMPATVVADVVAAVAARHEAGLGTGGVGLDSWGGAVGRVPASATAFPHRTALLSAQWTASWADSPDNGPQQANVESLAALRAAGGAGIGAYANYADDTLPDPLPSYYGPNLAQLRRVKQRYDPGGLLDQPQGPRA